MNRKLWVRLLWVLLAVAACSLQIRGFSIILQPLYTSAPDFYQEWASARNRFEGLPVYSHHDISSNRYREALYVKPGIPVHREIDVEYNLHPPTSVLLALPLARLDFADAYRIWAAELLLALGASIVIALWQCPVALTPWAILPVAVLLMWSGSFRTAFVLGQPSFLLLLLMTGAWAADRSQRPWLAGALLAAATAIKLVPGFLFLYFLMRRQGRALAAGAITFVALTALTMILLGTECYRDYITIVLPNTTKWRSDWLNHSLPGFWNQLFNPQGIVNIIPLWRSAALASAAILLSDALITLVTAWFIWRSRSLRERDLAFSLTMIAMLLVSPITWNHTLAMAYLFLFLLWYWLPSDLKTRITFWIILIILWIPENYWLKAAFDLKNYSHKQLTIMPLQVIFVLAIYTYALLAIFAFTIFMIRRFQREERKQVPSTKPIHGVMSVV